MQTPGYKNEPLDIKVSVLNDDFDPSPPVNYQQFENYLTVQKP